MTLNVGKAFYGDWKGSATDVITSLVGKAAGVDKMGEIFADQVMDKVNQVGSSC